MALLEERLHKKKIRQQRLEVLDEMNVLLKKCKHVNNVESCKNCQKVKALGKKLDELVFFQDESRKEKEGRGGKGKYALSMTVDQYIEYKEKKMKDSDIAKAQGVSPSALSRFKKRHNIELSNRKINK